MANTLYDALIAPHRTNLAPFLSLEEVGSPPVMSFSEFVARTDRVAGLLIEQGVKPGDRVLVQAPKRSDVLALYAATIQVGAVFLPLNTAYVASELEYFIEDAEPVISILKDERISALSLSNSTRVLTLNDDGSGTFKEALQKATPHSEVEDRKSDDLAALLYTSGTTGRSKGAMLSQGNLLSNTEVLVDAWEISSQDVLVHALPIFHTHGLFVAMNTALLAGVHVRFMQSFDRDAIIAALPASTLMMGVPTFYTRLLEADHLTRDATRSMRLFISGSAPLLAETHRAFTERTGHKILERYGMTETNMNTSNPYDGDRRAGTVGKPLPKTDLRIVDPQSLGAVEPGKIGLIEVRGPNVFQGYWKMPEKTAEEFRADGFFVTGDLGFCDDDGYVTIVGREKDLIISGGLNVYPKEIEEVLDAVEWVVESAVFGVPDADFGERIIATVVSEQGSRPDPEELKQVIARKLARFKHPREFQFAEALPRNAMGKVQKNVLRQNYES